MRFFTLPGHWWLPERRDRIVTGALNHDEHGIQLRLDSDLVKHMEFASRRVEWPIVLGETGDQRVTLNGAYSDFVAPIDSAYYIREVYFGAHLTQSPQFDEVQLRFSDLDSFLGANPAFVMLGLTTSEYVGKVFEVRDTFGTLRAVQDRSIRDVPIAAVGPRTHISIHLHTPRSLHEINRDFTFPIQRLVALGTSRPTAITSFRVHVAGSTDEDLVEIIFAERKQLSDGTDEIPDQMIFSRFDLPDPETSTKLWLTLSSRLPHALHLFFDYAYFRRGDVTSGIVHVVQSLEAYHRDLAKHPQQKISDADLNLLRGSFKATVEEAFPNSRQHMEWVNEAFAFSNQTNLRNRLLALISVHSDVMNPLIQNTSAFVRSAKEFRNAFAHGLEIGELSVHEVRELFFLIEKLSVLFRACLMDEIAISKDLRLVLFRRNLWYQHLTTENHILWNKWRKKRDQAYPLSLRNSNN